MNKALFLVLFAVSFSVLLGSNQDAHADSRTFVFHTTITTNEIIANGETWTVNSGVILTINPGVTITVQSGGTIIMPNGGTIDNRGTINNSGIISINSINTLGTLFDSGIINNGGSINIDPSSSLSINGGTLDNNSGGTINNSGSMANGGTLDNNSGGTINNGGHIVNTFGGPINNSGLIDNSGFISNGFGGTINNSGTIDNSGGIHNDFGGIIDNSGTINNSGTITNECTAVYSGDPPNGNPVNNIPCPVTDIIISDQESCESDPISGVWDGFNTCDVSSLSINSGDSVTIDSGIILVNSGTLNNNGGTITINSGGAIDNFGTIKNDEGGIININSGGTINNNPGSSIENFGDTINNDGTINNQCGAEYSGDPPNGNPVNNIACPVLYTIISDQTSCESDPISGVWNGLNKCTVSSLTINSGDSVTIHSGIVLENSGTINNFGTININSGGTIDTGGAIRNFDGIINNFGAINLCGLFSVYAGNSPNENPVDFLCVDNDNDGIQDIIDTMPIVFSNSFSDGATTFGTIESRGDKTVTISDKPDPLGVLVLAVGHGGAPATISSCGLEGTVSFDSGDSAVITCGSVTITVISGPVDIMYDIGGTTLNVMLDTDETLTIDPDTLTIITGPGTTITIEIDGVQKQIGPNETFEFHAPNNSQVIGGKIIPIKTTALFLVGLSSSAVWMIPTLAGMAGVVIYLVKFRNKEN